MRYKVTEDWINFLKSPPAVLVGWHQVLYQRMSHLALVILVALCGALVGVGVSIVLGVAQPQGVIAIVAMTGFAALIGLAQWVGQISDKMSNGSAGIYKPGSDVRYDLDQSGLRMWAWGQECWTAWALVNDVRHAKGVIAIQTPFHLFPMPEAALPMSRDDALGRIEQWREGSSE